MKVFLTILGVVIAAVGVYFAYQQFKLARQEESQKRPEVVVCLKYFSYIRTKPQGSGNDLAYVPKVQASFKLVNKGGTQVTVTKVMFNPTGVWKEGRHGGMGSLEVELNRTVPAYGVAVINNISFTPNIAILDKFWIDQPKASNVRAFWGRGSGPLLTCIPRSGGRWSCGKGSKRGISVDSACQ